MAPAPLSLRVAHTLLRCYPPAWRRRYADEVRTLIDESGASWGVAANLAASAAREWVSPRAAAWPTHSALTRAHFAILLASWVGSIALAWVSLYLGAVLRSRVGDLPEAAGFLAVGIWTVLSGTVFTGTIRNAIALNRGSTRMPATLGRNVLLGLFLMAFVAGILERAANQPSSVWLVNLSPYFRAITLGPMAWGLSARMIRLNKLERIAGKRQRRADLLRHVGPRLDFDGSAQV